MNIEPHEVRRALKEGDIVELVCGISGDFYCKPDPGNKDSFTFISIYDATSFRFKKFCNPFKDCGTDRFACLELSDSLAPVEIYIPSERVLDLVKYVIRGNPFQEE
jgi:hypothetical protein